MRSYRNPAPITAGSRFIAVACVNADLIPCACSADNSVSEYRIAFGVPPAVKNCEPNDSAAIPAAIDWRAFCTGDNPNGAPGIVNNGTCHNGPFGHRSTGRPSTNATHPASASGRHDTSDGSNSSTDDG